MDEVSNINYAKLENRQIFFHGDIDDYASVAFILSSSLDRRLIKILLLLVYDYVVLVQVL